MNWHHRLAQTQGAGRRGYTDKHPPPSPPKMVLPYSGLKPAACLYRQRFSNGDM